MSSLLSEGFAPVLLSRSNLISSSAELLLLSCSEVVVVVVEVEEGDVAEFSGAGPLFDSADGVICAPVPRWDHQYQPPIPKPPTNNRMNSPRIAPCHQRNCEEASGSPYADSIVSDGAILSSLV